MRHGYMGFVIKLANLIKSIHDNEELNSLEKAKEVFGDSWVLFLAGELQVSNERNCRSLGGKMKVFMEDDDNQFEVNMEKIMSRFTTFNSIVSSSSDNNDNDEEEEEREGNEEEPDEEEPLTQLGEPVKIPKVEVTLPNEDALVAEYSTTYWR